MQTLLGQLNAVQGVVGSLVCDAQGGLLAQAFPPVFEAPMLRQAAKIVADGRAGLEGVAGPLGLLDFRYGESRILVKPVRGASLLFLCAAAMNPQPLAISAAVAAPKIEKLVAGRAARPAAGPGAGPAGGQLLALVQRIDAVIDRKKLDRFKVRGAIALQAGFALNFIDENTPDDPAQLQQLRAAASAVLGETP